MMTNNPGYRLTEIGEMPKGVGCDEGGG
jgi:hypothetical protein